jgi:predicted HicB family RNase H-like nuclease
MAIKKPERKTAAIALRIRPSVKRLAEKRAKAADRSLANFVEQLIVADAKRGRKIR